MFHAYILSSLRGGLQVLRLVLLILVPRGLHTAFSRCTTFFHYCRCTLDIVCVVHAKHTLTLCASPEVTLTSEGYVWMVIGEARTCFISFESTQVNYDSTSPAKLGSARGVASTIECPVCHHFVSESVKKNPEMIQKLREKYGSNAQTKSQPQSSLKQA